MERKKLRARDIFEIPASDGRRGYGQIVIPGTVLYAIVFEELYAQQPVVSDIASGKVLLVGWTTDALIYHGKWRVIGSESVPINIPFPNYKVSQRGRMMLTDFHGKPIRPVTRKEAELLDYKSSVSPAVLEDSLFVLHQLASGSVHEPLLLENARKRCIV